MSDLPGTLGRMSSLTDPAHGTLAERVLGVPPKRAPRVHVWVDECAPGIVVSWQRGQDGAWLAQCAYVESAGRLVVEWLASARVRPV